MNRHSCSFLAHKKAFSLVATALAACGPSHMEDGLHAYSGPGEERAAIVDGPAGPIEAMVRVVGNHAIVDGDILFPLKDIRFLDEEDPTTYSATIRQDLTWPNGVVPYEIGNVHYPQYIRHAMDHWENHTSIRFVRRTSERYFVRFVPTNKRTSSSYLGRRIRGGQNLTVSELAGPGTIIHEIGHAIGLLHEHNRQDRDNYVTIQWDNIDEDRCHPLNFKKHKDIKRQAKNVGSYDFNSIMHYSLSACSKKYSQNTIEPKPGAVPPGAEPGQRRGLSPGDIAGVASLYGASEVDSDGKRQKSCAKLDCKSRNELCILTAALVYECVQPFDCTTAGLDWEGRCDGSEAQWCQDGQILTRDCANHGKSCGRTAHYGHYCLF